MINFLSEFTLTGSVNQIRRPPLRRSRHRRGHTSCSPGLDAHSRVDHALVEGMCIVGIDFRDGILRPQVLLAANSMKAGMEALRPRSLNGAPQTIGKDVIGQ